MRVTLVTVLIVIVLVLGLGGLYAVRVRGTIELFRAARSVTADLSPAERSVRRRRLTIASTCIGTWYATLAAVFLAGRAMGGVRAGAGLGTAWFLLSVVVGVGCGVWWDRRHGNL